MEKKFKYHGLREQISERILKLPKENQTKILEIKEIITQIRNSGKHVQQRLPSRRSESGTKDKVGKIRNSDLYKDEINEHD